MQETHWFDRLPTILISTALTTGSLWLISHDYTWWAYAVTFLALFPLVECDHVRTTAVCGTAIACALLNGNAYLSACCLQTVILLYLHGKSFNWTTGLSASYFLLTLAGCFPPSQSIERIAVTSEAVAVSVPIETLEARTDELESYVAEWKEHRSKLSVLVVRLDRERLDLIERLQQLDITSVGQATENPRARVLLDELRSVHQQQEIIKNRHDEYDLAILKSESRLRTIERRVAALDAGINDGELESLRRSIIDLSESLAIEQEADVPAELDQVLQQQLAKPQAHTMAPKQNSKMISSTEAANPAPATSGNGRLVTVLTGHRGYVWSSAFSLDGRRLAVGSQDGIVSLWDTQTWKQAWSVQCTGLVRAVGFSADSRQVLVHHLNGIQCYDSHSGDMARQMDFGADGWGRFNQDGTSLLIKLAKGSTGYVYSVKEGKKLFPIDRNWTLSDRVGAFSPDGRYAYYGAAEIRRLDLGIKQEKSLAIKLNRSTFTAYDVARDGRYLATGSGRYWNGEHDELGDQLVRVWDLKTLQPIAEMAGHRGWPWSVCFHPDGKRILSGGAGRPDDFYGHRPGADNSLRIWWIGPQTEVQKFEGHSAAILSIACSPDGKYAATGSSDASVRVWQLPE